MEIVEEPGESDLLTNVQVGEAVLLQPVTEIAEIKDLQFDLSGLKEIFPELTDMEILAAVNPDFLSEVQYTLVIKARNGEQSVLVMPLTINTNEQEISAVYPSYFDLQPDNVFTPRIDGVAYTQVDVFAEEALAIYWNQRVPVLMRAPLGGIYMHTLQKGEWQVDEMTLGLKWTGNEWADITKQTQEFMAKLEEKLTQEYGPSVINAESPVQTYTIEGPAGEPMEIIGQRMGLSILAVTPELKRLDLFSRYGDSSTSLDPNKKAGEVLRFIGTESQAELLQTLGSMMHLLFSGTNRDSIFSKHINHRPVPDGTVWADVYSELNKYVDLANSDQRWYSLEVDKHIYKDSSDAYIKEVEILNIDSTKPMILIEDVPWSDFPGVNNAQKEKNSGAILMSGFDRGMGVNIWVTSKGELVVKVSHLDPDKKIAYTSNSPSNLCQAITASNLPSLEEQSHNLVRLYGSALFEDLNTSIQFSSRYAAE